MKSKHILLSTLICASFINIPTASAKAEIIEKDDTVAKSSVSVVFSENGKARALNVYWHRMAQCETGGDWKNKGKWSGGLGIYTQTWIGYGGKEFASKPEFASIDEQITIANRISTQGYQTKNEFLTLEDRENNKPYFRPPAGFGGWGCKKHVGNPALFKKFPSKILFKKYRLGDRNNSVRAIQRIIGVGVDGYFGPITDRAYNKFFTKYRKIIMDEYIKYTSKTSSN